MCYAYSNQAYFLFGFRYVISILRPSIKLYHTGKHTSLDLCFKMESWKLSDEEKGWHWKVDKYADCWLQFDWGFQSEQEIKALVENKLLQVEAYHALLLHYSLWFLWDHVLKIF